MRRVNRTTFRPAFELVEARIVASSGLGSPAHAVHAASRHHPARAPHHHRAPISAHPASLTVSVAVGTPVAPPPSPPLRSALNPTGASTEAWVELINMTGQDLEYQISLAPYRGGQFLPFDIAGNGPNSIQYRMSSLIGDGQRVQPSFAIQFDNGPVAPLNTGISAQAAREYYIFLDGNGQYYVSPTFDASASR